MSRQTNITKLSEARTDIKEEETAAHTMRKSALNRKSER